LAVSVVYIVIFSLQQIDQQRNTLINYCNFSPEITQKSLITKRSEIYLKAAIQAVKKGVAKSGSPTQNGQGEKL